MRFSGKQTAIAILTLLSTAMLILIMVRSSESYWKQPPIISQYATRDWSVPLDPEIKKVKQSIKKRAKKIRAEAPGVFLEALKEIKTARDGSTYPANYKHQELLKAKARARRLARPVTQNAGWMERGPGNVSGRSRAIVMDPADSTYSTGFVATVGGGIWKFSQDGTTWQNKTPNLSTLSTTTLAMCKGTPDVMYAGTGMGYGRVVDLAGSGIWKTIDRGETWFQLASTANNELLPAINRIVVNPDDPDHLLVCSNGDYTSFGPNGGSRESGIFLSLDGGGSWEQTFFPDAVLGSTTDNRVQQIIANPENFNTLYAAVNEVGVIKSMDGGRSWTVSADNFARAQDIGVGEGSYQGISTRTELAISPTDTARVYAAVERRFGIAKLFMTRDAGLTWVEVIDTESNPNWFNGAGQSGATGAYCAGWFDNCIAVHPFDEDIVFVGGVEIYRISVNPDNNTRSTTEIASTFEVHADHHWLELVPTGETSFKIFNANDGGIAISYNGGSSWQQVTGMGTTQFYGADKKPGVSAYFGGMQDNGTWYSNANPTANSPWNNAFGGDGVEVAWNYSNPDLMLLGYQYGNLYRSVDGGQSFNPIPDAKAGSDAPFISKIANSKLDPDLVFTVGSGGVKRSDDFGASWTWSDIPGNWIGWRAFDNVEISVADPQVVWISSRMNYEPWVGKQGGIHVSSDGGLTFTEISQNLPDNLVEASGIGTHPSEPNTAYLLFSAANGPKIMKTTDLGQTWEDISGFTPATETSTNGFPNVAVFSLLVMPHNENIIWAGTEIGLFVSEDGGAGWQLANNGLPNVGIFQMSAVDSEIVLATYGRGVWSATTQLGPYELPVVTLSPRLEAVAQAPSGYLLIEVELRSAYDSTLVVQNSETILRLGATDSRKDTTLSKEVLTAETVQVQVHAYKAGRVYKSPLKTVTTRVTTPRNSYVSKLGQAGAENDFSGNGFSVKLESGFPSRAIHSLHPYGVESQYIYNLNVPIIVRAESALMSYRDIALIEEGTDPYYTQTNFWDYVIVEGTRDGITWLPLVDGYDSRLYRLWSNAYNDGLSGYDSNTPGDPSLFFKHEIDLLDVFEPGDVINVRFRLYSDPLAVAWGWAIDSIKIQATAVAVAEPGEHLPKQFALHQNYPNPFNPTTTISWDLPAPAKLQLLIYDLRGNVVKEVQRGPLPAGSYNFVWDGRDDAGQSVSSGQYFCRLTAGSYAKTIKILYLK